jgi:hypothetical protein
VMTASFKLTRNTTFSAIFRGDAFTTARTVTSSVATRTIVNTYVSGHYGTKTASGTLWHLVRRTANPVFETRVPHVAGRKQYQTLDYFTGTTWKPWQAGYFELTAGKSITKLGGTHTIGVKYRLRSAYLYGKSGDTFNTTTYGKYVYFQFTN